MKQINKKKANAFQEVIQGAGLPETPKREQTVLIWQSFMLLNSSASLMAFLLLLFLLHTRHHFWADPVISVGPRLFLSGCLFIFPSPLL